VAQTEKRRELVLAGKSVAERVHKSGLGLCGDPGFLLADLDPGFCYKR
jgi:hypothetical protein